MYKTITFLSNYINHHQIPFCEAMYASLGKGFVFIQAMPMEQERVQMGWGAELSKLPFLRLYYEEPASCKELVLNSDVVLFGGIDEESYIEDRLEAGGLTIRMSERLYKEGQWKAVSPKGLLKKYHDHTRYRNQNVYLLCSGAYVASDFAIVRAYPQKKFCWGYFPETKQYDIERLLADKDNIKQEQGKLSLLFAGRFIDWKHPEYAVMLAEHLKKKGYSFSLTMVGGGELEDSLHRMVREKALEDVVCFEGFRKPEEVRTYMEEADIFLFTSDFKEGWGAVLNEAMNSGCAVVANYAIGAVPYLVKHKNNGMIYKNKSFEDFCKQTEYLFCHQQQIKEYGRNAYKTIVGEWNAANAARRLLQLLTKIEQNDTTLEVAEEGICSKAPIISPGKMYAHLHTVTR